jgi:NADH:ubiquinone oxidoreductase subunit 3 (subunit A)
VYAAVAVALLLLPPLLHESHSPNSNITPMKEATTYDNSIACNGRDNGTVSHVFYVCLLCFMLCNPQHTAG